MKFIIFYLFLTLMLGSLNVIASDTQEVKTLMHNYLSALSGNEEIKLTKITSPQYLKKLKEDNILNQTIKKNQSFRAQKKKIQFDFEIKKMTYLKESFFVNIKSKESKTYGEYWYVVKKTKDGFIIDDLRRLDH